MKAASMVFNFGWLLEGQLAGAGQIGGWGGDERLEGDLDLLSAQGVKAIVSLTANPLQAGRSGGVRYSIFTLAHTGYAAAFARGYTGVCPIRR